MRRLVPLALIFLAVGLATAMALPFLALFLDEAVDAGAAQVAVFLVAAPVSAVVASTLVGRLSDRLPSRRPLLAGAALAGCAGNALTAVVRDYTVLLLVTVSLTALAASTMPQVLAYSREALHDSGRVAMTMSSLRTLFSVAWVAGPPLAAVLLSAGGFTLLYAASAVTYAVVALIVLAGARQPRPVPSDEPGAEGSGADAPRLVLWLALAVFVVTRSAGNLSVQALPLLITREIGGDVQVAGWLLGLCAGLEIPLMLGFGWLSTRIPVRRLLIAGTVCGAAYTGLVSISMSVWVLAAGQVLNAASIAALTGLGITYVQDMLPRHRGRASTLYSNTFPVGALIAGPVLGAAQLAGYRMLYVAAAALYLAAFAMLLVPARKAARKAARELAPEPAGFGARGEVR